MDIGCLVYLTIINYDIISLVKKSKDEAIIGYYIAIDNEERELLRVVQLGGYPRELEGGN